MTAYDPQKHNRRSIRLKNYDYSSPGKYYLTLCTQNRACLFGEIKNGEMQLNGAGRIMNDWWNKIPEKFPNACLDVYQIMPNHFHAIVGIIDPDLMEIESKTVGADPRVSPNKANDLNKGDETRDSQSQGGHAGPPQQRNSTQQPDFEPCLASVPGIIQWFKTMTTNKYIQGVKEGQFSPFNRKLWQRNYYEHVIRDEKSLQRIREYIINNPAKWEEDQNNPDNF